MVGYTGLLSIRNSDISFFQATPVTPVCYLWRLPERREWANHNRRTSAFLNFLGVAKCQKKAKQTVGVPKVKSATSHPLSFSPPFRGFVLTKLDWHQLASIVTISTGCLFFFFYRGHMIAFGSEFCRLKEKIVPTIFGSSCDRIIRTTSAK